MISHNHRLAKIKRKLLKEFFTISHLKAFSKKIKTMRFLFFSIQKNMQTINSF